MREQDFVVSNAVPIPYFGDCAAYLQSDLRIVMAALNPSDAEFTRAGTARFDLDLGLSGPLGLEGVLSEYFKRNPYTEWFSSFEPVLNGMGASYSGKMDKEVKYSRTALHLDMCSPIATSPTWSKLPTPSRDRLTNMGKEVFEELLIALKPHIVIASVGWDHITSWNSTFANGRRWQVVVSHEDSQDGTKLRSPLKVHVKMVPVGKSDKLFFVNGSAADRPFGRFTTERKTNVGKVLLTELSKQQSTAVLGRKPT